MGLFFNFASFLNRQYPLNTVAELTKIRQRLGKGANRGFPAVNGFRRLLSAKMMPLCVVLFIMVQSMIALPVSAYEPGEFPGKGDYHDWKRAGLLYNEGCDLADAKKHDAAIAKYKSAIAVFPYDPRYYNNLGVSYDKRNQPGDLINTETAIKKAIKLCPDYWKYWAYLADVVFAIDSTRAKESIAAAQTALTLKPPTAAFEKIKQNIARYENKLHSATTANR